MVLKRIESILFWVFLVLLFPIAVILFFVLWLIVSVNSWSTAAARKIGIKDREALLRKIESIESANNLAGDTSRVAVGFFGVIASTAHTGLVTSVLIALGITSSPIITLLTPVAAGVLGISLSFGAILRLIKRRLS